MHRSTLLPRPAPQRAAPCSTPTEVPPPLGVPTMGARPRWARDSHEYTEVDLDDLVRSSLAMSIDDLVQRHHDDQHQQRIEAAAERRARQLSAAERRNREEVAERLRLRAAEEHSRLVSLHRRQQLAQEQAAIDVQAEVQEIYRRAAERMRAFSKTARQGQTDAFSRLQEVKRSLFQALVLSLVLLSAGVISLWQLDVRGRERHADDMKSLERQASAQDDAAKDRAHAMEQALDRSRTLNEQQTRALKDALSTLQERKPLVAPEPTQSATGRIALVRPLKRANDLNTSDQQSSGGKSLASWEVATEPTFSCLPGDPLCFGL